MNVKLELSEGYIIITEISYNELQEYFSIPNELSFEELIPAYYVNQPLNVDLFEALIKVALELDAKLYNIQLAKMTLKNLEQAEKINQLILGNYLTTRKLAFKVFQDQHLYLVKKQNLNSLIRTLTDYAILPTLEIPRRPIEEIEY